MKTSCISRISCNFSALALRLWPFDCARWRAIPFVLQRCNRAYPESCSRIVRSRHGFRIKVDVSDWLGRHIFVTGEYEPATTAVIRATLRPGDVFVDVGANAGYFSLLAASLVGSRGKVFSFEPVPVVRAQLQTNLDLNEYGNCCVLAVAASNVEGEAEMYVGPANHRGVSSLRRLSDASEMIRVPLKRLDDILMSESRIDLVKIDVEGAECHVLEGMQELLQRFRPTLVLEVTKSFLESMERTANDIERIVSRHGYKMYAIRDRCLEPLSELGSFSDSQFNAYFSTPDRLPSEIPVLASQSR